MHEEKRGTPNSQIEGCIVLSLVDYAIRVINAKLLSTGCYLRIGNSLLENGINIADYCINRRENMPFPYMYFLRNRKGFCRGSPGSSQTYARRQP
jgi:hypothetical protein